MGAELIIITSIFICACTVLFDLMFVIRQAGEKRLSRRRLAVLNQLLYRQLEHIAANEKIEPSIQKKLSRKLLAPYWMDAFITVTGQLSLERPHVMRAYYWASTELWQRLIIMTRKHTVEQRSQLAYLLHQISLDYQQDTPTAAGLEVTHYLSELIVSDVVGPTIYLRENTLRAIIGLGNAEVARHALRLMNEQESFINQQILADDLLEFPGDCHYLLDALYGDFCHYSRQLKVAVINYLRLLDKHIDLSKYSADLLKLLKDEHSDGEVRLAAMRFFQKHTCGKAYPILLQLLNSDDKYYNYAAVAASSLKGYPGSDTVAALTRQLAHKNWYVRYNCADSLLDLGVDAETIISQVDDRYARDMLIFRSEIRQMRESGSEVYA